MGKTHKIRKSPQKLIFWELYGAEWAENSKLQQGTSGASTKSICQISTFYFNMEGRYTEYEHNNEKICPKKHMFGAVIGRNETQNFKFPQVTSRNPTKSICQIETS